MARYISDQSQYQQSGIESTNPRMQEIVQSGKTKDGRFRCGFCSMYFSFKSQLEIHKRRHTGDKPFVCQVCHKGFAQKNNLKSHMIQHIPRNWPVKFAKDLHRTSIVTYMRLTWIETGKVQDTLTPVVIRYPSWKVLSFKMAAYYHNITFNSNVIAVCLNKVSAKYRWLAKQWLAEN